MRPPSGAAPCSARYSSQNRSMEVRESRSRQGALPLEIPIGNGLRYHQGGFPHSRRSAMNAFIEHHQPAIRFDYACFDRILLNGVIQVLQNPACVVGFLKQKRQAARVTPAYFRAISTDYHHFVQAFAEQRHVEILMPPK